MQAVMTVGISGSGKSTFAREYVETLNKVGIPAIDINRDTIRFNVVDPGGDWTTYKFTDENEAWVTRIAKAETLLCVLAKQNIVLSNTNLNRKNYKRDLDIFEDNGYDIQFVVFNLPLELCIERDAARGKMSVGETIIRRQYEKLQSWLDNTDKIKHPITMLTT